MKIVYKRTRTKTETIVKKQGKVIAVRGSQRLIDAGNGKGIITSPGVPDSPSLNINSILARGYWVVPDEAIQ